MNRILHSKSIEPRLNEFRQLKDGWLDGKGLAPDGEGLDWFGASYDQHFPVDLPTPFVYPTPEGGVQAEWTLGEFEITLEVNLFNHLADWQRLNLTTQVDDNNQLELDKTSDWKWIADQLRETLGESG